MPPVVKIGNSVFKVFSTMPVYSRHSIHGSIVQEVVHGLEPMGREFSWKAVRGQSAGWGGATWEGPEEGRRELPLGEGQCEAEGSLALPGGGTRRGLGVCSELCRGKVGPDCRRRREPRGTWELRDSHSSHDGAGGRGCGDPALSSVTPGSPSLAPHLLSRSTGPWWFHPLCTQEAGPSSRVAGCQGGSEGSACEDPQGGPGPGTAWEATAHVLGRCPRTKSPQVPREAGSLVTASAVRKCGGHQPWLPPGGPQAGKEPSSLLGLCFLSPPVIAPLRSAFV